MKKTFLMLVLACGLLLTGCAQLTGLTDKQSDVIAEYMAGSVLRYTDNYMEGLVYPEDIADKTSDKTTDTKESSDNNSSKTDDKAQTESTAAESTSAKAGSSMEYQKFYKILSDDSYQVKFKGFKLYDSYAQRDNYFTLQPTDGKKLLVVNFKVTNTTKKAVKVNLGKIHIDYKLHTANGKAYSPMVTLLDTDLNYLNYTLKGGKSDDAVLVFDVPAKINNDGLTLSISLNGQNTEINLNE
ncbi:DUF4352 domain-containing protein [Anaerocolumna xylanovorans]|uniref:DUF4352 domain-containing protein n=1 Tax=Anaerocolumna xylanovorans DSM 12503 TaxID=1121345 RepID=A0A1M7YFD9_9FIRM|nr:DUF4352 domain-containing protein [Anaerocolumna xylanovorans]SHO51352.1 protein of unknown function [Anaerocolumna xylanovorans DSM 12503]